MIRLNLTNAALGVRSGSSLTSPGSQETPRRLGRQGAGALGSRGFQRADPRSNSGSLFSSPELGVTPGGSLGTAASRFQAKGRGRRGPRGCRPPLRSYDVLCSASECARGGGTACPCRPQAPAIGRGPRSRVRRRPRPPHWAGEGGTGAGSGGWRNDASGEQTRAAQLVLGSRHRNIFKWLLMTSPTPRWPTFRLA